MTLPLTVLATFLVMWLFDESINLMSMGGLAVAIGLVIDDAVVVVENIHRRLSADPRPEMVDHATRELIAPVVGSTLTTVVVFAPLGLLSGVVGQFFKALSLTLSVAVLVSLALAFTLIPVLARWAVRPSSHDDHARAKQSARWYTATLPALIRHLDGEMSLDEAAAIGAADTRHYAKRQFTWFRTQAADWRGVGVENGQFPERVFPEIFPFIRDFLLTP